MANAQQSWFARDTTVVVSSKGTRILNPWAGGINASQFQKMDLNADGIEDLIVFDRTNGKVTTLVASSSPLDPQKKIFLHTPTYESYFPTMENWMILADYNKDGLKDLFTSTPLGIRVYQQVRVGKTWSWKLVEEVLSTKGFTQVINLQVSGPDIPGIVDIDGDGDLDIITFDFGGEFIELHQNLSMEKYGVPDSLGQSNNPVFARNGECWGNFYKGTQEDFVFGVDCGVSKNLGRRIFHAGNSILLRDLDGDGIKDLLIGHVSNEHISFIKNSAAGIIADFTSFSNNFPVSDPAQFYIFPAAFIEDIDFDGVDDLVVAPSVSSNDNNMVDFKSSNWFYHNAGTNAKPDFKLIQKNLLQDQMIDVGENAAPTFFDVDGDGDLDMIIGTGGMPTTSGFKGGLWLLKNTGTTKVPIYEVSSENYLDISSALSLYNLKPQWADFNGDGVVDLGFVGVTSSGAKSEYRFIPNKGAKGGAVQLNVVDAVTLTLPPDTQVGDSPCFYDADGDGDLDLVVGKPQGNIHYYKNSGEKGQFAFSLETDALGGVTQNYDGRFVNIAIDDFDLDGRPDMLTVDHTGNIRMFYEGTWGKWTKRAEQIVQQNGKPSTVRLGKYLNAGVADFNGDGKPDVAVGTNGGGLSLFTNILPISITGVEPGDALRIEVFPNPTRDYIKISSTQKCTARIMTASGLSLITDINLLPQAERELSIKGLPAGLYIAEFTNGKAKVVKKLIIQ